MTAVHGAGLLEREEQLEQLLWQSDEARAGRGRVALVEGAAGTGKSALLAATTGQAEATGLRVLRARGSELEQGFAFGAIRQLFETAVTSAAPAQRERLLAGAAAPAAWVVAPGAGREAAAGGAEAGLAALHGVYWLATNLSLAGPLVLAVDDLHWVDASSLRALTYLAIRIADLPIALIVAMRPDEPSAPADLIDQLRAAPDAARIVLEPLGLGSVTAIVRGSIPDADPALCSACFEASAGNPFYLRELLRTIAVDPHGADAEAVRDASIPTVAERVERRIARVGPEAVVLARAMAVLGDGARLADAAAVAGLDEDVAASGASRMRRVEVLASEDPFAFVHPLVRRSVYDALSVTERDTAHAGAAARLASAGGSPQAVAAHLGALRPAGSAAVAGALREAARHAMTRAAPEAATGWLCRAIEEGALEPPRSVLLHELGHVELLGRDPAAIEHLREALELTVEPALRARIAFDLCEILVTAGRWEQSIDVMSNALGGLGEGDRDLAAEFEALAAATRAYDPRLVAEFDRDRERLRQLAEGDTWAARALAVLLAAVQAARGEELQAVLPLVEHGLCDGRLLAERGAGGWAAAQTIQALVGIGAEERALEVAEQVAAEARRSGAVFNVLVAANLRGWVNARRGELAEAEAEIRPPLDVGVQNGMSMAVASAVWCLLDAMVERPSLDDVAALVESFQVDPIFLATTAGAMLLETRGRVRLARGDPAGAIPDLRAALATHEQLRFGPTWTQCRSALALALPAGGREEALGLVEEELALAAATGLARPRGIALRAAGLVRGDEDGLACLRESVVLLAESSARLEHARSLVELGAALRRRGQRARAREPLAVGMELAHRCGAERLLGRAREELRATGARPRRIVRSGVDALTASERRVARLVAEGRTNSEVAQELFVSLKTVETHLSHVYAKLDLTGRGARRRLADVLEQAPP